MQNLHVRWRNGRNVDESYVNKMHLLISCMWIGLESTQRLPVAVGSWRGRAGSAFPTRHAAYSLLQERDIIADLFVASVDFFFCESLRISIDLRQHFTIVICGNRTA